MNENYKNPYNDEMEINLIDLMFYFLKRWKTLAACLLAGVVLGGVLGAVKGPDSAQEIVEGAEDPQEVAEELDISDEALANMELAYQYRLLYQNQARYNQNSVWMQLDAENVYRGVLKLYVSAGDDTELLSLWYENMVSAQSFIQELCEKTGLDCGEQYARELVTAERTQNASLSVSANGQQSQTLGAQPVVVTYRVLYSDARTCEKMLDVVREKVGEKDETYAAEYEGYSMEILQDTVEYIAYPDLLTERQSDLSIMNTALTNGTKLEDAFTDEEMSYYESVYLGNIDTDEDETTEGADSASYTGSMAKWILIGAFLGVCIWGFCYLARYLMDKRVKYAEELSDCYGLSVIGRYRAEEKPLQGIEKWRDQAVNAGMTDKSSEDYIASSLTLLDLNALYLAGDIKDPAVAAFQRTMEEKCAKVKCGGFLQSDSGAIGRAKESAGVVFLVRVGADTHRELQRELEICRLQKLTVVGAIALE